MNHFEEPRCYYNCLNPSNSNHDVHDRGLTLIKLQHADENAFIENTFCQVGGVLRDPHHSGTVVESIFQDVFSSRG